MILASHKVIYSLLIGCKRGLILVISTVTFVPTLQDPYDSCLLANAKHMEYSNNSSVEKYLLDHMQISEKMLQQTIWLQPSLHGSQCFSTHKICNVFFE